MPTVPLVAPAVQRSSVTPEGTQVRGTVSRSKEKDGAHRVAGFSNEDLVASAGVPGGGVGADHGRAVFVAIDALSEAEALRWRDIDDELGEAAAHFIGRRASEDITPGGAESGGGVGECVVGKRGGSRAAGLGPQEGHVSAADGGNGDAQGVCEIRDCDRAGDGRDAGHSGIVDVWKASKRRPVERHTGGGLLERKRTVSGCGATACVRTDGSEREGAGHRGG